MIVFGFTFGSIQIYMFRSFGQENIGEYKFAAIALNVRSKLIRKLLVVTD